jgi:hypothetical protein
MSVCPVSKRLDITGQCGDYPECDTCDGSPRGVPPVNVPLEDIDLTSYLREYK